jgi:prepilin-type N-terminal cleavage/methylation domain-containing protein
MGNRAVRRLTPISTTGNWNSGYTLLELTIVVFLIGLLLTLAVPRFQDTLLFDDMKTASRRMIGTITTLKNRAVRDHKEYTLHFDLVANRFWVQWQGMSPEEEFAAQENSSTFPDGVTIVDVSTSMGAKQSAGGPVIHFTKKGYVEPAVIHLRTDQDTVWTMVLSPFLGKVKTYDRYVAVEET